MQTTVSVEKVNPKTTHYRCGRFDCKEPAVQLERGPRGTFPDCAKHVLVPHYPRQKKPFSTAELELNGKPIEPFPEESALVREACLMPYIVADHVICELVRYLDLQTTAGSALPGRLYAMREGLSESLAKRAEACYAANRRDRFGKLLRGRNGRDWIRTFMRHWLSAELIDTPFFQLIPDDFKRGLEPMRDSDYLAWFKLQSSRS